MYFVVAKKCLLTLSFRIVMVIKRLKWRSAGQKQPRKQTKASECLTHQVCRWNARWKKMLILKSPTLGSCSYCLILKVHQQETKAKSPHHHNGGIYTPDTNSNSLIKSYVNVFAVFQYLRAALGGSERRRSARMNDCMALGGWWC